MLGAPIAPIGDLGVQANQAAGNATTILDRNEEQPMLGHGVLHALKELAT